MDRLKPCPFCGSKATLYSFRSTLRQHLVYYIECNDEYCSVMTRVFYDKDDVINAWNRRAEDVQTGRD